MSYFRLKLFIGSHQITYTGQRDLDSLRQFIRQQTESIEVDMPSIIILYINDMHRVMKWV